MIAGREVRASARTAGVERLQRVARQLADLTRGTVAARDSLSQAIGSDPAIRAALAGRVDTAAVQGRLRQLTRPQDQGLSTQLWSADRQLVASLGSPPPSDPEPLPPLSGDRSWGAFREVGEESLYWATTPIREDARTLGWFALRQRLGSRQTAQALGSLLGSDIQLIIGNRAAGSWAFLDGRPFSPPTDSIALDTPFSIQTADGPAVAVATALPGTPWVLLGEIPIAALDARPRAFIERMALVGLLLLLAIGLVGWQVSHRLTAPLEDLATAADALARGEGVRRVPEAGGDELALLGRAFNGMSDRVAEHAEALREGLEEARALAASLQDSNVAAEQARADAQAANQTKSEFLATMSHEIRTPINAVIGYTDLLAQGIPDPPTEKQKEFLKRIDRSSRLLISLVDDVLDFARIESGEMRVQRGIGAAADVVQTARAALEPEAAQKGLTLSARCAPDLLFQGDPRRVQQIVLNLVSNAVKFTARGGSVDLACTAMDRGPSGSAGDWLRVDVRDTGIGIRPEELRRIFEPFVQAETGFTREHGGVGLGLAISRALAVRLGGDVTVESEPGRGSCFSLWLPAVTATAPAGKI